eukprot:COSAG03_NODE_22895_length_285_cov_1.629032_1_plen_39_part_10
MGPNGQYDGPTRSGQYNGPMPIVSTMAAIRHAYATVLVL